MAGRVFPPSFGVEVAGDSQTRSRRSRSNSWHRLGIGTAGRDGQKNKDGVGKPPAPSAHPLAPRVRTVFDEVLPDVRRFFDYPPGCLKPRRLRTWSGKAKQPRCSATALRRLGGRLIGGDGGLFYPEKVALTDHGEARLRTLRFGTSHTEMLSAWHILHLMKLPEEGQWT